MTKFNPNNKKMLTYGEALSPAMEITEQVDASQYLANYITHIQNYLDKQPRQDGQTAKSIAKANLGYYAGYYDDAVRVRVEQLFRCAHPVFGAIIEGKPSAEETFNAGVLLAQRDSV